MFTVDVESAGSYKLDICYANGSDKSQYLVVNDVKQVKVVMPNTSDAWETPPFA